jgi:hypothetical protein
LQPIFKGSYCFGCKSAFHFLPSICNNLFSADKNPFPSVKI